MKKKRLKKKETKVKKFSQRTRQFLQAIAVSTRKQSCWYSAGMQRALKDRRHWIIKSQKKIVLMECVCVCVCVCMCVCLAGGSTDSR